MAFFEGNNMTGGYGKGPDIINSWIVDNINDTYIQINENFSSCSCYNKWIK